MNGDPGKIMVIQPRTGKMSIVETEAQRLHQMKVGAGIRAEANRVPRVGWNLGLKKDDVKHGGPFCPLKHKDSTPR